MPASLQAAAPRATRRRRCGSGRQFESLFMQELMKSMRAATMSSGMLDNEGSKLGTEMLDTQLAGQLTGLKGGLSDAIMRQLERQMGLSPGPAPAGPAAAPHHRCSRWTADRAGAHPREGRAPASCSSTRAAARQAEAETGIPAAFMVAQAAHETGWGRKEIRHADGSPAAQPVRHQGRRRLDRAGGRGHHHRIHQRPAAQGGAEVPRLRSHEESFADYAKLMKDSPRYAGTWWPAPRRRSSLRQGLQRPATPPTRPMPTS
jgi:flagellar protein FlgJ